MTLACPSCSHAHSLLFCTGPPQPEPLPPPSDAVSGECVQSWCYLWWYECLRASHLSLGGVCVCVSTVLLCLSFLCRRSYCTTCGEDTVYSMQQRYSHWWVSLPSSPAGASISMLVWCARPSTPLGVLVTLVIPDTHDAFVAVGWCKCKRVCVLYVCIRVYMGG